MVHHSIFPNPVQHRHGAQNRKSVNRWPGWKYIRFATRQVWAPRLALADKDYRARRQIILRIFLAPEAQPIKSI
jgi:hypothetical protein